MAPKTKIEPAVGQRTIQAFFAAKPKSLEPSLPVANTAAVGAANDTAAEPLPPAEKPEVAAYEATQSDKTNSDEVQTINQLVGKGVRVYWPADDAWYEGSVIRYQASSKKHLVVYEDGDEEWLDFKVEKVEFSDTASKTKKHLATARKKAKSRAVIESDDSGDDVGGNEDASESEYAVSEDEDSASDEESLVAEREEYGPDDSDEEEDVVQRAKKQKKANVPAKSKGGGIVHVKNGAAKAAVQKVFPPSSVQKTPGVAVANRMSITPGSNNGSSSVPRPAVGHTPASRDDLRAALDRAETSPGGGPVIADAAFKVDAARFAGRDVARFPFLHPDRIRDAGRRRPDDPSYDPTTVYVPHEWFKQLKISEGQRQWWEFKAAHWGSVLLFKMGKFYEMFEMDAHVGAECLGLSYMKGDQPHCGFPEAAYAQMAERLARAGHRVVVIEQTETPEQLAVRNEERRRQGLKKDNVVRREKVAVLSRGTLTEAEMMSAVPDAQYLMSITEKQLPKADEAVAGSENDQHIVLVGAAAVDVATGQLLVGQWRDDELRSHLRAVLTALSPVEVVLPRAKLSGPTRRVLLGVLRSPIVQDLTEGTDDGQFWTAEETVRRLLNQDGGYFTALPPALAMLAEDKAGQSAAISALGGCLSALKIALLDRRVLAVGRIEPLEQAIGLGASWGENSGIASATPACMALDGPALENLEVLENGEGGVLGTLLAALDHCTTPFGRRRLRQWLARPLCRTAEIIARQDAVEDLIGPAEEAAGTARRILSGLADLERSLTRLSAAGAGVGSARDAPRVVLYEDASRKRVKEYVSALQGLDKLQAAVRAFGNCGAKSSLLVGLVEPRPDLEAALDEMRAAADWEEAEASGRVVPAAGVDAEYDDAMAAIAHAEGALSSYLDQVQADLGCQDVRYASLNKESHVLEVPEGVTVPRDWESMQGKKGWRRYINAELKELVAARSNALDAKEKAQTGILQGLLAKLAEKRTIWAGAVDAVAQLDALMSLAVAAACSAGPMCRPKVLPWATGPPIFNAKGLRHPAGVGGAGGTFVPNDIVLGGETSAPFIVLTGPNMGGKSTLMRQVCLAAVAAQVGAWVPAESLELSPADAVFVRMGARDRIMLGQSTFFVELAETAAALARATRHSIVALDELGRGTATTDGAAIASAVLDRLASVIRCRGVFATHYHHISDAHSSDPAVAIKHMACVVLPPEETGGVERVAFLYRLTEGACPKSYGVNVAKLAGLPDAVVKRAAVVSQEAESRGLINLRWKTNQNEGEAMEIDDVGLDQEGIETGLEALVRFVVKGCRAGMKGEVHAAWNRAKEELNLSAGT